MHPQPLPPKHTLLSSATSASTSNPLSRCDATGWLCLLQCCCQLHQPQAPLAASGAPGQVRGQRQKRGAVHETCRSWGKNAWFLVGTSWTHVDVAPSSPAAAALCDVTCVQAAGDSWWFTAFASGTLRFSRVTVTGRTSEHHDLSDKCR